MSNMDYAKIIKRSWELTWKNRWLWVMGLVLAAFGGGIGKGGSGGSRGSSTNIPNVSPSPSPVLREATNIFKNWFENIPKQN